MTARAIAIALIWALGGCHPGVESNPPAEGDAQAGARVDEAADEASPADSSAPDPAPPPASTGPSQGPIATEPGPTTRPRPPSPAEPDGPLPAYDRAGWKHWIDADGDCQDTRTEILIAQSEVPVTFTSDRRCQVAKGRWVCPYTGKTITDPAVLDIDHLVPLARAHAAGGGRWDSSRRAAYANDLDDPMALVAVDRSANRSRGAKGVHEWLPPDPTHRCDFLEAYANLARRFELHLDPEEEEALFQFLETCDAGHVPELSQLDLPVADVKALTDPEPDAPPSGRCCKRCNKGKPCGDTCIPKNRTCHAAPGCAC